jgi:Na+-driven multidrug efflux pump
MYNAAVRKLVLIIPLALLLPGLWGLGTDGVFLSECISDVLAAGNTVIVYLLLRKRII